MIICTKLSQDQVLKSKLWNAQVYFQTTIVQTVDTAQVCSQLNTETVTLEEGPVQISI
jgi:hypothetical protein